MAKASEPAEFDIPEMLRWAICSNVDRVTAEVATALSKASIETILLKGPAIATWLYSEDQARLYTDTDLLIRKQDWERAIQVLQSIGFHDGLGPLAHPRMESGAGHPWGRTADEAEVDLHCTLFGVGTTPEAVWATFSETAVIEQVGGVEVYLPSYPARLLHIALHAVQHGGDAQLKPMMDLELALAKIAQRVWVEAREMAESLDSAETFAAGLRLTPEGKELASTIGASRGDSAGASLRLDSVPLAEGFQELAKERGLWRKLRLITRELFPTPTFMRWWTPLANRGRTGLVAAYVWRLFWLASRTIPGFLAWRRAVRSD